MAKSVEQILRQMSHDREWNLRVFGKATDAGCSAKRWREYYEKKLEEEMEWVKANPNNPMWRKNVELLRKKVEEYRKLEEMAP